MSCASWPRGGRTWAVVGWMLVAGHLSVPTALSASEPDAIATWLKREIVGPALPLAQWQAFCEPRIAPLKVPATAGPWEAEAERLRAAVLERVVFRGAAQRWRDAATKVQWLETIPGGPSYRIKKLRYEALPGFWIPALLYEPEKLTGKVPVIMNVNGHVRAPGKAVPYKQIRSINLAKRGMLALNVEWIGMGQLSGAGYSHASMNQLDLCGTSGLAPFYLSMQRGLDLLLSLEHADPQRLAVSGLSGGGWQTIVISALDRRVTLANPVAGYSSFHTRLLHPKDLGDSEQTPCDLAMLADYTHLTAMRAPRPTLLTYNSKDNCCFESGYALAPLLDAAGPAFALFGKRDALRSHVNDDPGTHNYELDNRQAFYRMLGDFFCAGQPDFNAREIPSDAEVQTKEQLLVELPRDNADFHTLAVALARDLPHQADHPRERAAAVAWQTRQRARLREVVRATSGSLQAIPAKTEEASGVRAAFWRLQTGGWDLPAVELAQGQPKQTALLVADGGRGAMAAEARRLLAAGYRVVALDPTGIGEAAAPRKELAALLIASVGARQLGLQAEQIAATARWCASSGPGKPVMLVSSGPRSSVMALVATALEEEAIAEVELHGSLGTLKEIVEENWPVTRAPELFCFGLLEAFDVQHLAMLAAPRPVSFPAPGQRARKELAALEAWYNTFRAKVNLFP